MESAKALPAPNSPRPASPVVFKNSLLRFIACDFLGLLPLVTKKSKKVPTADPKKERFLLVFWKSGGADILQIDF